MGGAFLKKLSLDLFYFILGGVIVGVSISCFAAPNNIAAGGFSGIATLINHLFNLPIGTVVIILNIPVFVLGARVFGRNFLFSSLIATLFMSVSIDLCEKLLPKYYGDDLLSAIFSGVLSGFGFSLVFVRGATTGGVDIIAKVINRKYRHLSMGKMIMMLDAFVVVMAIIVYRNFESALYSIVLIFVQSRTLDSVLYGADKCKVLLISSKKYNLIAKDILQNMKRGVTFINAKGAYSGDSIPLILCAVRPFEVALIHRIIKATDESAFIVTMDAGEIVGEGFKNSDGYA